MGNETQMKTIRQAADEFGVTKQAVGKFLRENNLKEKCVYEKNRLLIPESVYQKVIEHFSRNRKHPSEDNQQRTNPQTENFSASVPIEVYHDLIAQLAEKDKQIESLNQALLNAQTLHASERTEGLLPATRAESAVKEGAWSRFKRAILGD